MKHFTRELKTRGATAAAGTCLLALALVATPATASLITVGGNQYGLNDSFTVSWSETVQIADDVDGEFAQFIGQDLTLSGQLTFDILALDDSSVEFGITALHTTDTSAFNDANVFFNAFGFYTDPSIGGATITLEGDYFDGVTLSTTFPDMQQIDLCAFTGVNCPAGGPDGVPNPDGSDYFQLLLTGAFEDGLELHTFAVRHTGDLGSYSFPTNGTNGNGDDPPEEIPEPGTLLLLGVGLIAFGWMRRRWLGQA